MTTNEIDAWLACDEDGEQWICPEWATWKDGKITTVGKWPTHGHDIPPGQCRPVRLRVEVVKDGN